MKKTLLIITLCLSTILTFGQDTIKITSSYDWEQWAKDMEKWADNYAQNIEQWAAELEKNIDQHSFVIDIDSDEIEENMADLEQELNEALKDLDTDNCSKKNSFWSNVICINGNKNCNDYKYEKKKEITANYKVGKNALLTMAGKFGDIKISEWDKNEVDFRVEIKAKANKESQAQEIIDAISVDFSGSKSRVSAQTVIQSGSYKNCSYSIVYYVKVPRDIMMDLKNSYGDIEVGTVTTDFIVKLKYGDLEADSLLAKSNLDISYGDLDVQYANLIDIDMKYGDLKARNANEIIGKLSYSDMNCTEADKIDIVLRYTDTKIDKVNKFTVDDQYSDVSIYTLENELFGTSKYGDVIVRNVGKDFNLIQLSADYSDIRIGVTADHNFKYNFETWYGGIKSRSINLEKNASQIIEKSGKNKVVGSYGSNPSASISLTGNYSDIIIGQ